MIKNNQSRLNQLHVLIDILLMIASYYFSWWVVFRSGLLKENAGLSFNQYTMAMAILVPVLLFLYWMFSLYTPKRVQGMRVEIGNLFKANIICLLLFVLVLFLVKGEAVHFSRTMLALFFSVNLTMDVVFRLSLRYLLRKYRARGFNQKHVLLVGYSRAAFQYIDRIKANPIWGYQIRGILDDKQEWGCEYKGVRVIGTLDNLQAILDINRLDEIVITLAIGEYGNLEEIVAACEKSGVHTKFVPDYNQIIPTKPYTEDLMGLPVIHIRSLPLSDTFYRAVKRLIDIVGASLALLIFSPIMLLTAICVRLSSQGPILYKQERVGIHNRPFYMYKFRSMEVQDKGDEKRCWTTRNDPRVTNVGKFIRKTSIDEFPQFFNVLIGNMSLVGPRPERPLFVEKFKEEIPRYMIKHQVRPGITGWAQVNGYRGDTSIVKRIEYDLYYIENWTLSFDFRIIMLTFFKGFINRNAY